MKRPIVEPSSPYRRARPASSPTASIESTASGTMRAASVPAYAHAKPRIANALMDVARVRYDPPLSTRDPSHPPSAAHEKRGWLRMSPAMTGTRSANAVRTPRPIASFPSPIAKRCRAVCVARRPAFTSAFAGTRGSARAAEFSRCAELLEERLHRGVELRIAIGEALTQGAGDGYVYRTRMHLHVGVIGAPDPHEGNAYGGAIKEHVVGRVDD